ncbi:MAG: DUF1674 domain-containing protein [Pseudomonadota bacterium]
MNRSIFDPNGQQKIRKRELLAAPGKKLDGAAKRALTEAAERRRAFDPCASIAGDCVSDRLDPTRYGDWEAGGKCRDF